LAQGAFNKLYIVRAGEEEVVIRVTLPVDPQWKKLSEVATLKWVRTMTHLPIPRILAYGADRSNPIGFEYIIMNKVRGKLLVDMWQKMNFEAKASLVCELASFCAETFQQQIKRIGSLLLSPGDDMGRLTIGRIVSAFFIWDDHIHQDVPRGPFRSSKAWLSARLTIAENDCRKRLDCLKKLENRDEDQKDTTLFIISKLRSGMDEFFPINSKRSEPTMIFHDDLSRHNILIDEKGVLTGVGKRLDEQPIKSTYQHDENGEVVELYWEDLENYELTQLRRIFLDEMRWREPRWVEIFESNQRQRDFGLAVTGCGDSFLIRRICNWLKDMDSGVENFQGLEERIDNASL
ncbi:hypothetical protein NA56DRAFT_733834, partial [Hyaloscypha hepaticicola]